MNRVEETKVAIIGAGVSGLTLATFLQKSGIPCVVLERRNRTYIEKTRQRAGVVDARGVRMFEQWELADKLLGGALATTIDYRLNGVSRVFEVMKDDGGSEGRFCTQQMLVTNLMKELIDVLNGDIRFDVTDVTIKNEENLRPQISYTDEEGLHVLNCDYIVGCDGDRGVSRASIPQSVLTKHSHEFGYSWLAALVETPLLGHPIMGISDYGFVGQLPRGPQRSRFYLQCELSDTAEDWNDERLWNEIRLRLNDKNIKNAPVLNKQFVPLRCVVYSPMQYRNLFLVGDAAHLVTPVSAKGANLALYDVDILSQALINAINNNDTTALKNFSNAVLPHIWNYQDFAVWITEAMHDAGSPHNTFKQMIARSRIDNLFKSPTAAKLHSEYQKGTN